MAASAGFCGALKSSIFRLLLFFSSVDGVNEVGEVKVSDLEMEGETDDRTTPEIQVKLFSTPLPLTAF